MPYRLKVGSHTTHGKTYRAGYPDQDVIDDDILSEKEIEFLGDRIVQEAGIETDKGKESGAENKPDHPDLGMERETVGQVASATKSDDITVEELLAKNVPDIEAEITSIIDITLLDSIQQEEIKGKGRAGVFKAIEARKGELRAK